MDLNRLFYFVTVAECGSYTKAGKKLFKESLPLVTSLHNVQNEITDFHDPIPIGIAHSTLQV